MALDKVVAAYLSEVDEDLRAARQLTNPLNRGAAYHLEQAAEKLVKAVRLARGLEATKEHRIDLLLEALAEDALAADLDVLAPLSAYATTYRYPSPAGNIRPSPPASEILIWANKIEAFARDIRAELEKP